MQTYYVATLSHYVLVEAASEADAHISGAAALRDLYRANGKSPYLPIRLRLVRLATADEVELQRGDDEQLAESVSTEPAASSFVCPFCDLGWEPSGE